MSAPRTKRQFAGAASDPAQRQITSFFASQHPDTSSANYTNARAHNTSDPASPSLPATVQANLLSVGMRVRKSVPEGYKTGSYSAFTLWDENNSVSTATMGEGRSRANAISTPRELLPFCGINKVGGLGTQPENTQSFSPAAAYQPLLSLNGVPLEEMMDEDVPGLTSSQDSIESTGSRISSTRTRKRSYTEDEDEAPQTPGRLNIDFNPCVWGDRFDGEISPRSVVPIGWGASNGRVMATPRKTKFRGSKLSAHALGQDNVRVVGSADGTDFEEADFLVGTSDLGYRGGSRGWEVEMSDV
ncbi:ribonucleotide reductase inhibitor-domain-containing protein [Daldinia decipiens]|uniref:ribonucleotide reductase inhibitor-domain-containing protein n=1 Tax=Daldinia decipiens TaxID=326647 RepID=UPI0020C44862|nr:ribonucleotide reductase inhibitor-domain-containing protein [Daldinia decipiens]KAI1658805.1 ribonucleotide reductase inhibitor-domain-containing protein [Daldinia decipiens]